MLLLRIVNANPQYESNQFKRIESLSLASLSSGGNLYFEHSFVGTLSSDSKASDSVVFITPAEFTIEGNVSLIVSDENGEKMITKNMMYFSTPGLKWATLIGTEMSVDYIKSSPSLKSLILVNGLMLPGYNDVNGYILCSLQK
jgi:hypothetical protein